MAYAKLTDCSDTPSELTSVHTEETSGQLPPLPGDTSRVPPPGLSYGEGLRLKYPNEWDATRDAYALWDLDDGGTRLDRLEECRTYAWFAIHETSGLVRVLSSACHLRWCPLCAEARAAFLSHSVRAWYKATQAPKLLTLTLRHSDIPLHSQIDLLYQSFRKLRRSKYIASRVRGGIWFFQIKWSKDTDAWHPHIHALIDANFIPQAEIKARWAKYTKGSDIVDIRACWSPDSAANHVGRYATRPGTLSSVPPAQRLELLETLHGRRIVGAWGTAKSVPLAPPKSEDKDVWRYLGTWRQVRDNVTTSMAAKQIYFAWCTGFAAPLDISLQLDLPFKPDKPWLLDPTGNEYYSHSMFDP